MPQTTRYPTYPTEIEALLRWSYQNQQAHKVLHGTDGLNYMELRAAGVKVPFTPESYLAQKEAHGLFLEKQSFSPQSQMLSLPDVCEALDRQRLGLPNAAQAALVLEHALLSTRPAWQAEDVFVVGEAMNDASRQVILKGHREIYQIWHGCLCQLAEGLRDLGYPVSDPAAPLAPWGEGGCDLEGAIGDEGERLEQTGGSQSGKVRGWRDHDPVMKVVSPPVKKGS